MPEAIVVVVVMEIMLHTCVPRTSPCVLQLASLMSEEVIGNKNCLRPFRTICGRHGNMLSSWKFYNRHTYQVSSLCVLPLESLRSEEVNLKKSARGYLLLFTNMYCCDFDVGY